MSRYSNRDGRREDLASTRRLCGADFLLFLLLSGRRGMAKMKNELLRQQFKETEPIRQREVELHNTRDLARQTTLVVRLSAPSLPFLSCSLPCTFPS